MVHWATSRGRARATNHVGGAGWGASLQAGKQLGHLSFAMKGVVLECLLAWWGIGMRSVRGLSVKFDSEDHTTWEMGG